MPDVLLDLGLVLPYRIHIVPAAPKLPVAVFEFQTQIAISN